MVDGVQLQRTDSSSTNDPRAKPSSSGFAFCSDAPATDCPVVIDTLNRQPDAFASFDVSREFKPGFYVGNEENWEAETGH